MATMNASATGPISVPKLIDVKTVAKSSVTNDHGENLGRIDTLMLDLETGKIAYAVLSYGGFPNRTKILAVPWELLTFSHHDKKLILNVPEELLTKTAGYDTFEQVTQAPDFYWLGDVYEYYSHKTEWDQKRSQERDEEAMRAQKIREQARRAAASAAPPKNS
jgi:sporulation protein YlmC with PRC-barrel domain